MGRLKLDRVILLVILILFSVGSALAVYATNRGEHHQLIAHEKHDSEILRSSLLASCDRVNILRTQFNDRGAAMNDYAHGEITLATSVLTDPHSSAIAKISARLNILLLSKIAEAFARIPLINCFKVIGGE